MDDSNQVELVRRAAAGDSVALEILWRGHRRWVAAVLLAHQPPGVDLDDLLQEVAVQLCEHIGKLREPDRFLAWLRSIALNRARSAARRSMIRARVQRSLGSVPHEPPDPASLADGVAGRQVARVLELARRLDPDYGEPLILKCVRGLSQRAIADLLGLPETTVETRLARARRMLRRELEREGLAPHLRRVGAEPDRAQGRKSTRNVT